jgi:hypothetical protein
LDTPIFLYLCLSLDKELKTELYEEYRQNENREWLNKTDTLFGKVISTDIIARNAEKGSDNGKREDYHIVHQEHR